MGNVKIRKILLLLAVIAATGISAIPTRIQAADPTANDLVVAVNAYRSANGYYTMNPHSLVFQAAQTHAEWIVATGQGGHIGAGGSDETMRVSWTGYGGGADIQCDENWASGRTIEDAVYGSWSDWVHQEVMLNQWGNLYTDIGGGVASKGDGSYVFVLNVCKVIGQEASGDVPVNNNPDDGSETAATSDFSNYIYSVVTATPQADGRVTHVVKYGQTLASIAEAYGVTIEALRELNGFAPDFIDIWPDDELIIKQGTGESVVTKTDEPAAASTSETPSAEPTETTPTATARPTHTPSSMELTATAEASAEVEEDTTEDEENEAQQSSLTIGMLLLVFAGLGLVIVVFVTTVKEEE